MASRAIGAVSVTVRRLPKAVPLVINGPRKRPLIIELGWPLAGWLGMVGESIAAGETGFVKN